MWNPEFPNQWRMSQIYLIYMWLSFYIFRLVRTNWKSLSTRAVKKFSRSIFLLPNEASEGFIGMAIWLEGEVRKHVLKQLLWFWFPDL